MVLFNFFDLFTVSFQPRNVFKPSEYIFYLFCLFDRALLKALVHTHTKKDKHPNWGMCASMSVFIMWPVVYW